MDYKDMIVPPADDAAGDNQNPPPPADDNSNQPANPPVEDSGEPEGASIDNDSNDEATGTSNENDGGDSGAVRLGETPEAGPEQSGEAEGEPEESTEPSATAETVTAKDDQPATQLEDPGDFTPSDYSFDIELADGTKMHISKPEDIDRLPEDADFGTPANLLKVQSNFNKMTIGLDNDKREYEAKKQAFETESASQQAIAKNVENMVNGLNYLETKGKLPKYDQKYETADWSDPEVAKQPGIKERLELLEYRANENVLREKAGLEPMTITEAFTQRELEGYQAKQEQQRNTQNDKRKAQGAMVGGASAAPAQNIPDDLIIGEGGSTRDISAAYI